MVKTSITINFWKGGHALLSPFVTVPVFLIMAVSVYTDLRRRMIYDWLTLPGIAYFLVVHAIAHPGQWMTYALGVIVLGGISLVMAVVSNGQLGGGDIKLFALMGSAVGWQAGLLIMGLSYIIAGFVAIPLWAIRKRRAAAEKWKEVPLAPFIAGGTILLYMAAAAV
ncbi:prepilin peptidase [Anoxybacillus sediminis]|jgi:leader peptidase (prepilin peptidase)/N-methyltransferase|nr:A24 family peptidase [Brevibacillus sp. NL20B1]MBR8658939.1 prepilin peptidase [Brevibacillus sp. NL20B1]UFJ62637.1 prepilin peptidase [Anoxybacillus sediminis]